MVDSTELDFIPLEDKLEYVIQGKSIPVAEYEFDMGSIILSNAEGKEFEIDEEKFN